MNVKLSRQNLNSWTNNGVFVSIEYSLSLITVLCKQYLAFLEFIISEIIKNNKNSNISNVFFFVFKFSINLEDLFWFSGNRWNIIFFYTCFVITLFYFNLKMQKYYINKYITINKFIWFEDQNKMNKGELKTFFLHLRRYFTVFNR